MPGKMGINNKYYFPIEAHTKKKTVRGNYHDNELLYSLFLFYLTAREDPYGLKSHMSI